VWRKVVWRVASSNCRRASASESYKKLFYPDYLPHLGTFQKILCLLLFSLRAFCEPPQQFDTVAAEAAQARNFENLDEAVKLYQQAVQLRPDWAEGWWYIGTIAYDRGEFQDAIEALTKVIKLAPRDANAFAMLGLSEAKLNQNQPALAHLSRALNLGVGEEANMHQVVLFTEANLLLGAGTFGRAQELLDQLARARRNTDDDLLIALGRSVLGVKSVGSTTASETRDLILAAGRAEMLAANREISAAMSAYEDLVKRFPKVHNVEFAYGRFLLDNHLDDQAVAAFKREIANSPQHLLARLGIAGALLQQDPATSRIYAEQAVTLAPKLEDAHYLLGASLLATGDAERSVSELETAERLNPNDPRVYFVLEKAYKRVHRNRDAVRAREKFVQLSPGH
jgi:tetratricopeptide (TPR) repeat protein